jgi:hypothetical protein
MPTGSGPQQALYAWWVTAIFQPRDEAVEGTPVSDLDPDWVRASTLRPADLLPETRQPGQSPEEYGFSLALEADLDGDGRPDFRCAETFWIEEMIDPRETRPLLCEFANLAAPLRRAGRSMHHMRP